MTDQSAEEAAPPDGETRINRDWARSLSLLVICVGIVAASVYGVQLEPSGYIDHRFRSGSFIMLPAFSVLSVFVLYRCFVPWGAPVRINAEGFADLRAGKDEIPWSEISNVVRKGEYVSLTLRRKYARSYPFSLSQKALKATRKSAGPTHLLIAAWCLKTSSHHLLDTISAYREKS
ncbi:MAG: hypothetical protein RDA78_00645 [Roseibium sp.]|uniref:hypothetical protein n=1 Tax=Roseibium sp. TaxID=1936156 RepID=UPI003D9C50E6